MFVIRAGLRSMRSSIGAAVLGGSLLAAVSPALATTPVRIDETLAIDAAYCATRPWKNKLLNGGYTSKTDWDPIPAVHTCFPVRLAEGHVGVLTVQTGSDTDKYTIAAVEMIPDRWDVSNGPASVGGVMTKSYTVNTPYHGRMIVIPPTSSPRLFLVVTGKAGADRGTTAMSFDQFSVVEAAMLAALETYLIQGFGDAMTGLFGGGDMQQFVVRFFSESAVMMLLDPETDMQDWIASAITGLPYIAPVPDSAALGVYQFYRHVRRALHLGFERYPCRKCY